MTRALAGSPCCGDAAAGWSDAGRVLLAIADGLGHGPEAAAAAIAAITYVGEHRHEPLSSIFSGCNEAIRSTRGVALGLALVDLRSSVVTYAGVGNTRAIILGERENLRPTSVSGVVGSGYRRLRTETFAVAARDVVVLWTDGLPEHIAFGSPRSPRPLDLVAYAGALMEKWWGAKDDGGILVYQASAPGDALP